MENLFLEVVKQVNLAQVALIGLIVFYFYSRLDDKIKEEIKEVREDLKITNARIDSTNAKIDTLLLALFSKGLPAPTNENKDIA